MSHAVLAIDDEPRVLQSIKRLLHRDGYDIHLADNGPAALEILADTEIAVIICDQRMPGMSGAEVLAEAARLRPDTFRITLTAYTDLNAAQASINQGNVNHFLLKPWDDELLRKVVQDGVRAYQLIQDNRRLEALTRRQKAELEAWNQQLEERVRQQTEELRTRNANLLALQGRLEQSLRDTVAVLAGMLEAYSPSLGIHSKRVAELAHQLGTRLGYADQPLRDIEFAAHLHDIGKISKLHNPGALKSQPGGAHRPKATLRHPDSGYAILSRVAGFEEIAWAVQYQHERYDGTGYPEGLKGSDIPAASRIIAVVNAYDKAVFPSSNPTRIFREAGRRVLLEGQGKRFDPQLVALMLQSIEEAGPETSKDAEVELSAKQIRAGMVLSRDVTNINGVLFLKRGTCLTPEHIERMRALSLVDPLLTRVFVECAPEPGDRDNAARSQGSPEEGRREPQGRGAWSTADLHWEQADLAFLVNESGEAEPAVPGPEPGESAVPAGLPEAGGTRQRRVLIVDDSRSICNAVARDCRRGGFESEATDNGWEALALAKADDFEVAVIDLAMPSMSGTELIERLKQTAPDLPCIILTGNATKQKVVRLSNEPNVAGILVKPWDYDRLIAAITSAINEHGRQQTEGPG